MPEATRVFSRLLWALYCHLSVNFAIVNIFIEYAPTFSVLVRLTVIYP